MKDAWDDDDDDDDDWENAELALPAAPAAAAAAAAAGSDSEEETEEDRRRARAAETHKGAAGGPRQVKAGTLEAKIQAREASSSDVADINFGPDDDGPRGELDLSVGTREALAFYHDEAEDDADAASGLTDAQRRARKKASVERADASLNWQKAPDRAEALTSRASVSPLPHVANLAADNKQCRHVHRERLVQSILFAARAVGHLPRQRTF